MTAPRSLIDVESELVDVLGQAEALADLLECAHLGDVPPSDPMTIVKAAQTIRTAVQRAEVCVGELLDLAREERRA